MALVCPNCKARNRSVAKFCIECITSLPTGCADTDFAPSALAASRSSSLLPFSLKTHGSKSPAHRKAEAVGDAAPVSKGVWVSIAGLIVALVIGSAGWLVAGAGGWYLYTAGSAQVDPPRSMPQPVVAPSPGDVRPELPAAMPPVPDHAPAPVQTAPPVPENSSKLNSHSEGPVDPPIVAVKRSTTPRKATIPTPAVQQPIRELAVPQARETTEPERPVSTPLAPEAVCAGLNFIARSQCMAAQCLKREFRSHAQCEAVRHRQRIEEERRNPSAP